MLITPLIFLTNIIFTELTENVVVAAELRLTLTKDLKHLSILKMSESGLIDYLLSVEVGSSKILLGVIYRPPDVNHELFSFLEQFFAVYFMNFDNIIIMEDLNIHQLIYDRKTKYLQTLLNDYCLNVLNQKPTHHNNNSESLDMI
jgi:hypothetical protein